MALLQQARLGRPHRDGSARLQSRSHSALTCARRGISAVLAISAFVPPLLGVGGVGSALALLALAGLIAASIAPPADRSLDRLTLLEWFPIASLFSILGISALGIISAWAGTPFWAERGSALASWGLATGVPLAIGWHRAGRIVLAPNRSSVTWAAAVFAIVFSILILQPFEVWARVVSRGTDFARHAAMVLESVETGWLDYSSDPYPRSAHSALGLVQSAAGDSTYVGAWQSTEGMLLIAFALMVVASSLLAARLLRALTGPDWMVDYLAPGLVCLLAFSSPWVLDMMYSGFLTTFQAGLILVAAVMLLRDGRSTASITSVVGLIALSVLMAQTWLLLLPLVAAPALGPVARRLRDPSTRPMILGAGVWGLVFAAPVVHASVKMLGLEAASTPGGTTLALPGPAWLFLFIAACSGAVLLRRRGWADFGGGTLWMMLYLVGVMVLLFALWDGTDDGAYYLKKTAWTPFGLLLALGVPTVLWGLWRAYGQSRVSDRSRRRRWLAVFCSSSVALLAVVMVSQPPRLADAFHVFHGDSGRTALTVPLIDQLNELTSDEGGRPAAVVWGLSPFLGSDPQAIESAGMMDSIAFGALLFAGYSAADPASLDRALQAHDPIAVCAYLRQHPDTVRVTGPYPEGPLAWLTDSGCPGSVVRHERWISIEASTEWYRGTQREAVPFGSDYPTWAAAKGAVESLKSQR